MVTLFVPEEDWATARRGASTTRSTSRRRSSTGSKRPITATGASRRRTTPTAATASTASTRSGSSRTATRPTRSARSSTTASRAAARSHRSRRTTGAASSRRTRRSSRSSTRREAALANLANLERDFDVYGEGGFYDAVDVVTGTVSRYYLALDQGMVMAALANELPQRPAPAPPLSAARASRRRLCGPERVHAPRRRPVTWLSERAVAGSKIGRRREGASALVARAARRRAGRAGAGHVTIRWSPVAGAVGYLVQRADVAGRAVGADRPRRPRRARRPGAVYCDTTGGADDDGWYAVSSLAARGVGAGRALAARRGDRPAWTAAPLTRTSTPPSRRATRPGLADARVGARLAAPLEDGRAATSSARTSRRPTARRARAGSRTRSRAFDPP